MFNNCPSSDEDIPVKFYQNHRIDGASQNQKHESWSNTTFRDRRNMQMPMDTDKVHIQIPNFCLLGRIVQGLWIICDDESPDAGLEQVLGVYHTLN